MPVGQLPEALLEDLWLTIAAQGVQRCSLFVVPPFHSASGEQTLQFWWGYHPDWLEHYFAHRGDHRDDIPDYVLDFGKAILWDDIVKRVPKTEENQNLKAIFFRHHKNDGVSVPLYGPYGHNAAITFSFGEMLESAEDSRVTKIADLARKAFTDYILLSHDAAVSGILLSPRELEIMALSAKGDSNKELARKLGISPNSVDTYMRRIFAKLNVGDRVQAVVRCMALGLVRL